MALRWPNKDPDETLDYSIDWSRFLRTGTTISQVIWFVKNENDVKTRFDAGTTVNGLTSTAQTISTNGTVASIFLSGGTTSKYTLFCNMTDNRGVTAERSVTIFIREQ
jgi:non-ribosomal peptide synthetase component E (peptide arylation enzyme)